MYSTESVESMWLERKILNKHKSIRKRNVARQSTTLRFLLSSGTTITILYSQQSTTLHCLNAVIQQRLSLPLLQISKRLLGTEQLAQLPCETNQTSFAPPPYYGWQEFRQILPLLRERIVAKSTRSSTANMVRQNGDELIVLRYSCTEHG